MARLTSPPPFIGTVGAVTIYMRNDEYFMRGRSSLTAERVKTDPAFRKTMKYAGLLGMASTIASTIYALLPPHRRKHKLFLKLVGEANTWLKYQWCKDDIIEYLTDHYAGSHPPPPVGYHTRLRPPCRSRLAPLHIVNEDACINLFKTHPADVRAWRRRDRLFRQQYLQTFNDYPWSETLGAGP